MQAECSYGLYPSIQHSRRVSADQTSTLLLLSVAQDGVAYERRRVCTVSAKHVYCAI